MTNDFDPQDPKITAYALGELNPAESADMAKLLSQSTDAQRAIRDIRKTVGLLKTEFQKEAKPSLSKEHRHTIEQTLDPGNTAKPFPSRRTANRSRKRIPVWITACLLLVIASVWTFQSDLFKRKNGRKTEIVADNEFSHSPELLKYDRNEKNHLAAENSSASASPQKDRVGKRNDSRNAGQSQQEKTLSTPSHSKRKRRSQPFELRSKKNRDANRSKLGKITSPSKSKSGVSSFQGFSPQKTQTKNYRSTKKPGSQTVQELKEGIVQKFKQPEPIKSGKVLQIEPHRELRGRRSGYRDAYSRFYLTPKTSNRIRKQNRLFGGKSDSLHSGTSFSRSRSLQKNATKDLFKAQKKQKKPSESSKRKLFDSKTKRFFKLQNLDKNKKSSQAELKEKRKASNLKKNLDAAKEEKEADLSDDVVKPNRNEIVVENEFLPAMRFPNSTFPLDVGTVSYSEIVRYISKGQLPPPSVVRIEELLNAFQYANPKPKNDKPFAVTIESGKCPWNRNNTLVRIAIEGREIESSVKTKATPQPPLANDVELNVQFNPAKVGWHRLIGFEDGLYETEKTTDKNQFFAGHSVTALYEIAPANRSLLAGELLKNRYVIPPKLNHRNKNRHELLSIKLSYKLPGTNRTLSMIAAHTPRKSASVSNDFNWTAAVAMYGLLLRNSQYVGDANLELVRKLAITSQGKNPNHRRKEFLDLVEKTIELVKQPGK